MDNCLLVKNIIMELKQILFVCRRLSWLLFLGLLFEACGDANTWIGAVWAQMRIFSERFCSCGIGGW